LYPSTIFDFFLTPQYYKGIGKIANICIKESYIQTLTASVGFHRTEEGAIGVLTALLTSWIYIKSLTERREFSKTSFDAEM